MFTEEELAAIAYMDAINAAAENAVNWVPLAFKTHLGEYRQKLINPSLGYVYRGVSLDEAVEEAKRGLAELLADIQ